MDAVIILPLFAICGTTDALLPESRSIYVALREAGIPCESYELADVPNAFM
jgi:acetyl esterase/lipase